MYYLSNYVKNKIIKYAYYTYEIRNNKLIIDDIQLILPVNEVIDKGTVYTKLDINISNLALYMSFTDVSNSKPNEKEVDECFNSCFAFYKNMNINNKYSIIPILENVDKDSPILIRYDTQYINNFRIYTYLHIIVRNEILGVYKMKIRKNNKKNFYIY